MPVWKKIGPVRNVGYLDIGSGVGIHETWTVSSIFDV